VLHRGEAACSGCGRVAPVCRHGFAGLAQITPVAVRAIEDLAVDIDAASRSSRAAAGDKSI
jgi:hypothetical protein